MDARLSQRSLMIAASLATLLTLGLIVALIFATRPASAAPVATPAGSPPPGITVTGHAEVEGTPDTLRLDIGVSVTEPTVDAAMDKANAASIAVQQALRDNGVAEKDLQTTNVSVQPEYDWSGNTQRLRGYSVSQSLRATLRDIDSAGAVISAATTAGGDNTIINGLSFDLEDNASLLESARERAIADARQRAEQYASAAGRSVGQIVGITESVASLPSPIDGRMMAGASEAADAVPIAPGTQSVTVDVNVVFELK